MHKYKAFLSYSHRDKKWADWLHRRLETYKFPKSITPEPKPIKPVFRDREELSVASDLSQPIQDALSQSESLIVLCSPQAAKSVWVNEEIRLFRKLRPEGEVFCVIIDGEPHAEKSGLNPEEECFPEAMRWVENETTKQFDEVEPLAADFRKDGDGKQLGLVKLIAGIAKIRPDDLIQRDLRRARKRVVSVTGAAAAIILTLSLLTVSTVIAREAAEKNARIAEEQRLLAETRREEAEGLIEFMLGDLRQELEPVGRLSLLTNVADRALDYYNQVDEDLSNCRSASGAARARYLHTRIAVNQNDYVAARKSSDEALTLLQTMAENCKDVRQFVTNHAHALQWSADLDTLINNPNPSETKTLDPLVLEKYERAKSNLQNFAAQVAGSLDLTLEQVDADILIGKYYMSTGRTKEALKAFQSAQAKLQHNYGRIKWGEPLTLTGQTYLVGDKYADILSWLSGAHENLKDLDASAKALREARKIYKELASATERPGENWKARFDIIGSDYALARILYKQGEADKSLETLKLRKRDIDALVKQDPANESWKELQDKILSSISALGGSAAQ